MIKAIKQGTKLHNQLMTSTVNCHHNKLH